LKKFTRYVQQERIIEIYNNISDSFCEQFYTEKNQRFDRRKKNSDIFIYGSIYYPVHFYLLFQISFSATTAAAEYTTPVSKQTDPIDISGLLDIAVKEYTIWYQLRISSETFRGNIQKARDVALENCLDLKQIHDDQDPEFFVKNGVKAGAARRFVSDIARWVTRNGDTIEIAE